MLMKNLVVVSVVAMVVAILAEVTNVFCRISVVLFFPSNFSLYGILELLFVSIR